MNCQRRIMGCSLLSTVKSSTSVLRHHKWMWACLLSAKHLSQLQPVKQVYLLENTEEHCLSLQRPYKILSDVKQLGVRTVKGGFRRRPELIIQKQSDPPLPNCATGLQTYGLFDKCERIQQELTENLLCLMDMVTEETAGCLMLDIGCGHGWSLTTPCLKGFCVTGVDLDLQALSVVRNKVCSNYLPSHSVHVVRTDISNGLCFKESTFDVAISISFLQWLCMPQNSRSILEHFFRSLSFVLKPGGKAGIQFYPRNANDVGKVISQAQKYFKGAIVSDFPHLDRGRKLFLVLFNNKLSTGK